MYGYDADYSGFLELKAAREEMELATERKRQSVLRMELEWAKQGMPGKDDEAAGKAGTSGSIEERQSPGAESDRGTGICGDPDGEENH